MTDPHSTTGRCDVPGCPWNAWAQGLCYPHWVRLLGALGATRTGKHIAIDALPRALPPQPRTAARSGNNAQAAAATAKAPTRAPAKPAARTAAAPPRRR